MVREGHICSSKETVTKKHTRSDTYLPQQEKYLCMQHHRKSPKYTTARTTTASSPSRIPRSFLAKPLWNSFFFRPPFCGAHSTSDIGCASQSDDTPVVFTGSRQIRIGYQHKRRTYSVHSAPDLFVQAFIDARHTDKPAEEER